MIAAITYPLAQRAAVAAKAAATAATGMGFAPNLVAAAADVAARAVLERRASAGRASPMCAGIFAACCGHKAVPHEGSCDQAPGP